MNIGNYMFVGTLVYDEELFCKSLKKHTHTNGRRRGYSATVSLKEIEIDDYIL